MAGTTTVKVKTALFSWDEMVPLYLAEDGAVTFEKTGSPLMVRRTGEQAIGRRNFDAGKGEVVVVPDDDAERGIEHGQVEIVEDEPKPKRGPGRPRKQEQE